MPAIQPPSLCVLCALPDEAAALLPRMRFADRIPTLPDLMNGHVAGTLNGRTLSVSCSGVGMRNMVPHLNFLLSMAHGTYRSPRLGRESHVEQLPIRRLLICGFGGGLAPEIAPGDLFIADKVTHIVEEKKIYEEYLPDSGLHTLARSVPVTLRRKHGILITESRILTHVSEKKAVYARTGAAAVDMETAAAVRLADSHHVPWLAVRTISDGPGDSLPLDFEALSDADGNVDKGRVIRATLTHPWKIPALIRLGARSSLAAKNLATFIEAFLAALPESEA